MRPMNARRMHAIVVGLGLALAGVLTGGCSGSGSASSQQSSGGFFGLFKKKDPNADLTAAEGQKLLAEIRKDNKRLKKLTPAERRFVAKAGAAARDAR